MFTVIGELGLLNRIVFVLDRFNGNLFVCKQLNTLFSAKLVFCSKLVGLLSEISNAVLSATVLQKNGRYGEINNTKKTAHNQESNLVAQHK